MTAQGIKALGQYLKQNETIVHLDLGCNSIHSEGAMGFFTVLQNQNSLVSLNLANNDCYKNKVMIGVKGAQALGEMLKTNQIMQILDLTDNSLNSDALVYVVDGIKHSRNLVSLNLSHNDIGANLATFSQLLSIFKDE